MSVFKPKEAEAADSKSRHYVSALEYQTTFDKQLFFCLAATFLIFRPNNLTVRLCIRKTLNVSAWGDKVPPCSVSNILDNWLRIVARVSLSCAAIQAESNELFGVIIKRIFVKTFRKFQRHCFRRFSRDISCRGCGMDRDICWSLI